jgi:integrase
MEVAEALKRYDAWMQRERLAPLTRESYMGWAERYFAWSKDNRAATAEETISNFLSSYQKHSEATVKQALNALVGKSGFFPAMGKKLAKLPSWVNPTRPANIPTWVTQTETEKIMVHLVEAWAMMAGLMFGSGLRISECASLRWRDIDFERLTITLRRAKGNKDRVTVLSRRLVEPLKARMERCRGLWAEDRAKGRAGVAMPDGMELKFSQSGKEWPFFFVFPARGESKDPVSGIVRRHHLHKKAFGSALRIAVRRSGIAKRVTAHTFRHGFATAYLLAGGNLRELQRLLGHTHIETTEIYLHCLPNECDRIGSPWDVDAAPRPEPNKIITPLFRIA